LKLTPPPITQLQVTKAAVGYGMGELLQAYAGFGTLQLVTHHDARVVGALEVHVRGPGIVEEEVILTSAEFPA